MPRTTRRSEPSPSPDILIEDEPVPAINGAVEKVEHAAHSVQHYAHVAYRRIHAYIPHALLHRTKSEYYLMLYNTLTLFLWSYLTILVILHLSTPSPSPPPLLNPSNSASSPANPEIDGSSHKATAQLGAYISRILKPLSNISAPKASMTGIHLVPSSSTPPTFFGRLSHGWGELVHRAGTTYASRSIGLSALLIQSLAALEPLHAYLHLTRSPLPITASQIFSRLLVIWYFVESSPTAQSSPWYASMLLAWSSTEVIRSTYYLLSLLRLVPPTHNTARPVAIGVNIITTLRYTAFYALYPLGAGSEYALLLKGFPSFPTRQSALLQMGQYASFVAGVRNPPEWRVLAVRTARWIELWGVGAWTRVPFVVVWPVSLGVLMLYMHQQRGKVLGKGPGRSIPGGRLRDVGGKKRA